MTQHWDSAPNGGWERVLLKLSGEAFSGGTGLGVDPDVVASIAGIAGIPGTALGRIYIQNHRTTVDVSEEYLEKVVSANSKYKVRGQSFTLTKG